MVIIICYAFLLISIINAAYFLINENGTISREKFTCYECGFESNIRSRIPFSLRFFILTIVYLLFDIEVLVAFSYIYSTFYTISPIPFFGFIIFCLLTLYLEWSEGSLDWVN